MSETSELADWLDEDAGRHDAECYAMHGNQWERNCCDNQTIRDALRAAAARLRELEAEVERLRTQRDRLLAAIGDGEQDYHPDTLLAWSDGVHAMAADIRAALGEDT